MRKIFIDKIIFDDFKSFLEQLIATEGLARFMK